MVRVVDCAVPFQRDGYPATRMDQLDNPYRDQPGAAPLTRAGRLTECGLVLLMTFLAVYLSH